MEAITIAELIEATGGALLYGSPSDILRNVSTNSKEIGADSLFVPIIGERADAHNYIDDAVKNGAVCVLSSREQNDWPYAGTACVRVEDTLSALQSLAAYYRSRLTIPLIGITGSVGKTTTKEMVASALSSQLRVLKTAGNRNSQIGLPLTLFEIVKEHETAVIEMGMSEFGEMTRIAAAAKPDYAIITNIGVAHIGNLHSKENIRAEKLHITDFFHAGSKLFLNMDDELLRDFLVLSDNSDTWPLTASNLVSYGLHENADFRAEDITITGTCTEFTLRCPDGAERIHLQVLGLHNVLNALAALAVAYELGIGPQTAKKGLAAYLPIEMRGTISEFRGCRVIDDSYNASPDSMKSGLDVLTSLPDTKRRIAVLADVLELGELSRQCHYEVGIYIAEYNRTHVDKIDILVTIGTEAAILGAAAKAATIASSVPAVHSFTSNRDAIAFLKKTVCAGDAVLVKGSRAMHTDEIVTALLAS